MKFVLVLIILLKTSDMPDVYSWTSFNFVDMETCEAFKDAKVDYLNDTVERQFNTNNNVVKYDYSCMSQEDYEKVKKAFMGA